MYVGLLLAQHMRPFCCPMRCAMRFGRRPRTWCMCVYVRAADGVAGLVQYVPTLVTSCLSCPSVLTINCGGFSIGIALNFSRFFQLFAKSILRMDAVVCIASCLCFARRCHLRSSSSRRRRLAWCCVNRLFPRGSQAHLAVRAESL